MSDKKAALREKEDRLASLYDEYYPRVAHYAFVRIGDAADAEDIAGEVFMKALDSLDGYEDRGIPMGAWLFKIAHNLVVDHLRRKSQRVDVPLDSVEIMDDHDPVKTAELNLEIARVKAAMQRLTEEQREVVRLRFFGELTSGEVGNILQKSDGAVREMQRAAIEKLRSVLEADRPRK